MIHNILILIGAVAILAKISDIIVDKVISISKNTGIADITLGFIILSVSTSIPEIALAINSSVFHAFGVSMGDILGSNITNIGITFSIPLLYLMIKNKKKIIELEDSDVKKGIELIKLILIVLTVAVVLLVFSSHDLPIVELLNSMLQDKIDFSVIAGLIMAASWFSYVYLSVKDHSRKKLCIEKSGFKLKKDNASNIKDGLVLIICTIVLLFLARIILLNTLVIINIIGISGSFIGGTLIAMSTSIPEITVEFNAIKKNRIWLAIGNLLGSTITNTSLVLGMLLILSIVSFDPALLTVLLVYNFMLYFLFYYMLRRKRLTKGYAFILIFTYVVYLLVLTAIQYGELTL